jgi:hypothetical protein
MKTKVKNPFFNAKLRSFLLFLLLATTFWVLTRFSKQEAGVVTANLVYSNVPKGKLLLDSNPDEVSFTLSANKFEILYYHIKKPIIIIDISSILNLKNEIAVVTKEVLEELIQSQINTNLIVRKVAPQELVIALESLNFKDVPVEIVSNLKYKSGFGESGSFVLEPRTVTITGTKEYIDTIRTVKTVLIAQNEIYEPLHFKVPLVRMDTTKVKISPLDIDFRQNVVEFSQKQLTVDITVLNAPKDATLRLLPSKMDLTFNVPIKNFSSITISDFIVAIDYAKRNIIDNFVIPEIIKKPEGIKDIKMGTNKVDLLLFK